MIDANSTRDEIMKWLTQNMRGKGVKCPCCRQHVKLYKRPLYSTIAYGLIHMHRYFKFHTSEYVHLPTMLAGVAKTSVVVRGGDLIKAKFWKLIEPMPGSREDGSKRNGYWKLTELGKLFVERGAKVQEYALVFNNKCYGHEGSRITIEEALSERFDYDSLMSQ